MIIYVNDYDVGIEALPTPTITLLLLLLVREMVQPGVYEISPGHEYINRTLEVHLI